MSKVRTYNVETEDVNHLVDGTGFHIEGGHLLIESGGRLVAAFGPTDWMHISETTQEPEQSTDPDEVPRQLWEVARGPKDATWDELAEMEQSSERNSRFLGRAYMDSMRRLAEAGITPPEQNGMEN